MVQAGAVLLAAAWLCAGRRAAAADAAASALLAWRGDAPFREFVVTDDGGVWLFSAHAGRPALLWADGKWTEKQGVGLLGTVRHAVQPPGDQRWILLSQDSEAEVALYRFDGREVTRIALLGGRFVDPTLHVSADGTIWVLSRFPVAHGVKGEERPVHDFYPNPQGNVAPQYLFSPLFGLDVPGQGTWFWANVTRDKRPATPEWTINGFHVYRDGQWSVVPGSDTGTEMSMGGAVLGDDGRLVCGRRLGDFVALTPATGAMEAVVAKLPPDEACTFLHAVPGNHTLLAVTRPPDWATGSTQTKDGWTGTLARLGSNGTESLLSGLDLLLARTSDEPEYDAGRPVADTAAGTFLATTMAGLVLIPPDGKPTVRLDWRHGVPLLNVQRLRVVGDRLYGLDPDTGFAVFDWRQLAATTPTAEHERWSLHYPLRPHRLAADGSVWLLDSAVGGWVRQWDGETWHTAPPMPSLRDNRGSTFARYLTFDSSGRLWLINNSPTLVLDQGAWRRFDTYENACSTLAAEEQGNPGFRVGVPTDENYAVGAGDGRIAYRHRRSTVRFFADGRWFPTESESGGIPESGAGVCVPFYADGLLLVAGGDAKAYRWADGKWQPSPNPKPRIPEDARSVPGFWEPAPEAPLPPGFPGKKRADTFCRRDNLGGVWAGTTDELYHGLGDVWVRVPTAGTPVATFPRLDRVDVDAGGGYWFTAYWVRGGVRFYRVAQYRPPTAALRLAWASPPPTETDTPAPTLAVNCLDAQTPRFYTCRLDDGPTQIIACREPTGAIPLGDLANGRHTCEIRAADETLRLSKPLTHAFTVQRDYARECVLLADRLGAATDAAEREVVARSLVRIGAAALPILRQGLQTAAPDARWWFRALIEEIEGQGTK
jgi:hypothetical protein